MDVKPSKIRANGRPLGSYPVEVQAELYSYKGFVYEIISRKQLRKLGTKRQYDNWRAKW